MMEKAVIVSNGRGAIRTPSVSFPRPSVIRLGYMVRRPRPHVKLNKREVLQRDDYTCQYCGRQGGELTLDHVVPRHRGGRHAWTNLVTACPACNRKKGGKTSADAQMRLSRQPLEPLASATYLFRRYLRANQDWELYIKGW